jgi:hypothetical protein
MVLALVDVLEAAADAERSLTSGRGCTPIHADKMQTKRGGTRPPRRITVLLLAAVIAA